MRTIILLLSVFNLFNQLANAKAAPLHILQCLGKEEEYYFIKKIENSDFLLNQLFINELTSLPRFKLKNGKMAKVCADSSRVSHHLLLALIEEGPQIIEGYNPENYQLASLKDGIDQFFASIPEFFLQYLSSLQVYAPNAHCLEKQIPEIKKYLSAIHAGRFVENYDPYQDQKKNMMIILKKTLDINAIYKKCIPIKKKEK